MEDESLLEKLRAHVEPLGYPLFALSAASHTGTRELVLKIAEKLSTLPPVTVYEPEYVPKPVKMTRVSRSTSPSRTTPTLSRASGLNAL